MQCQSYIFCTTLRDVQIQCYIYCEILQSCAGLVHIHQGVASINKCLGSFPKTLTYPPHQPPFIQSYQFLLSTIPPSNKKPLRFNNARRSQFLLTVSALKANGTVDTIPCRFFISFGREDSANCKKTSPRAAYILIYGRSIRADVYLTHLHSQHVTRWRQFQALPDE